MAEAIQNLIEGAQRADFEADLRQGDGNELKGKFRAAHSSSALAVNTFAPFRSRLVDLALAGGSGFADLCFERKCPHGLLGRRPPNLDVVAESPNRILAIESKCLEHLGSHVAKFAPAYQAEITDHRCGTPWFRETPRLMGKPRLYRRLGAAQLIKHALGLAHTFVDRPVTLLYLFWEPSNPEAPDLRRTSCGDFPLRGIDPRRRTGYPCHVLSGTLADLARGRYNDVAAGAYRSPQSTLWRSYLIATVPPRNPPRQCARMRKHHRAKRSPAVPDCVDRAPASMIAMLSLHHRS